MKKIFYTSLLICTALVGTFVYAQTPSTTEPITGEYTVLAPIPGTTKTCTGSGADEKCTADINSYLNGFLGVIISIGAIIAMLYIAYYGFQYAISDSASLKMESKGKLFEIMGGLVLIISAYAIVYTINPKILPEGGLSLDISVPRINSQTPMVSGGNGGMRTTFTTNPDPAGDKVVRDRLINNTGISINRTNPCTPTQRTGCTSLTALPEVAITGVLTLNKECQCNLIITGGTETLPHNGGVNTEHGPGLSVVDLNPSAKLNSYLGKPNPQERDRVSKTINGREVIFIFEKAGGNASHSSTGDHWHVQFK